MSERRVYIVDDEEAIRRSAQLMLKVMGYTAQAFEHGGAFLEQLGGLERGCVLLDIRMPHIDGLEVQRRLKAVEAPHPIVMMSGHGDIGVAIPAIANGAVAFIEKPFAKATLEGSLEIGFARLYDPVAYAAYLRDAAHAVAGLGETERQVLTLLARGQGNETIASELDLGPGAVDLVRTRIFGHLRIHSLTEALQLAFAGGLIESGT